MTKTYIPYPHEGHGRYFRIQVYDYNTTQLNVAITSFGFNNVDKSEFAILDFNQEVSIKQRTITKKNGQVHVADD